MKNTIGITFVIFLLSSCFLVNKNPVRLYNKAVRNGPYDAAIVPGVPFNEPEWERTMRGRVLWSVYLYNKGIVKNVIYSGGPVYSPYQEGAIMALYAEAAGIPKEHIFAEVEAEHSVENVYYGYKMAKTLGFEKVAFVSDPFQTKLIKGFLRRKYDPNITRIPFITDTLAMLDTLHLTIDPSSAKVDNFVSLVDRESKRKRFQNTRGRKVRRMMKADREAMRGEQ